MVGIRYITRIKKVIAIKNIESSIRLIVNVTDPLFQVYITLSIYLLYIRIFLYATKTVRFDKIITIWLNLVLYQLAFIRLPGKKQVEVKVKV